jgi:uncharacterized protein
VTIPTLEGDTIENVAQAFFDTWKIGKKNKDNGLLLLVAVEDKKVRIHTGYGTETIITDSKAGTVIRDVITPPFKTGNFEKGISEGVDTLSFYLSNPENITTFEPPAQPNDNMSVWVVLFLTFLFTFGIPLVAYGAAFFGRSSAWWPGGVVGFILGALTGNWPVGIFFGIVGLFLDYILSKNYTTWKLQDKATDWSKTYGGFSSGSSWSSGSSSSSSGSGFSSFGGGSSGGGGASGGW